MSAVIDPSGSRIVPSISSIDFVRLGEEVRRALESGADWIHSDVMDNHYISNLTVGPLVCEAIRPHAQKDGKLVSIDMHLMVSPVDRVIPDSAKVGADLTTSHPEASEHIDRSFVPTCDNGCKAGLVFSPATPLHYLDRVMDRLDMVPITSVNPGFGGQSSTPEALNKLCAVRQRLDAYQDKTGRKILLEIDGGVEANNIAEITKVGVDTFVASSAAFGKPDTDGGYRGTAGALRQVLASLA